MDKRFQQKIQELVPFGIRRIPELKRHVKCLLQMTCSMERQFLLLPMLVSRQVIKPLRILSTEHLFKLGMTTCILSSDCPIL